MFHATCDGTVRPEFLFLYDFGVFFSTSLICSTGLAFPGQPSPHVDGVVVYKAKLCRQDSESLGLTLAPPKESMMNLLIIDVKDSPAIQRRNSENLEASLQIQVGHAILAVNGKTDPLLMMDQLASAKTLNLLLKDRLTRPQKRYFEESFQVYTQRQQRQQLEQLVEASSMATWATSSCRKSPQLVHIRSCLAASVGSLSWVDPHAALGSFSAA